MISQRSLVALAATVAFATCTSAAQAVADPVQPTVAASTAQGVRRVQSAFGFDETVTRIKADIAAKGIQFFTEIDQSKLGDGAKIAIRPSKLLLFGNPPLGVQFLSANPYAGLDWPVRILVAQDADGTVYVAYTDFDYMAARYALKDRDAQIKMASEVAGSIAGSVAGQAH
jgi:uncharacterized protein (DUF302 family)